MGCYIIKKTTATPPTKRRNNKRRDNTVGFSEKPYSSRKPRKRRGLMVMSSGKRKRQHQHV